MENYILLGIAAAAGGLFFISLFWKKLDFLLNLFLRFIFGILGIYIINKCLEFGQIPIHVGINEVTLLFVTLLGLPGLLFVYAIPLYFYIIG